MHNVRSSTGINQLLMDGKWVKHVLCILLAVSFIFQVNLFVLAKRDTTVPSLKAIFSESLFCVSSENCSGRGRTRDHMVDVDCWFTTCWTIYFSFPRTIRQFVLHSVNKKNTKIVKKKKNLLRSKKRINEIQFWHHIQKQKEINKQTKKACPQPLWHWGGGGLGAKCWQTQTWHNVLLLNCEARTL